jgi:protein-S-isoprenylcysteine O-methyltransferase Ste14
MTLFLKNLLFTVLVPGTVAVYLPLRISLGRPSATGAAALLAEIVFAAGAAIYLWCLWDFATFGRGTPAPIDAPRKLVVRGLYRYVRNPMYVGVLTMILGWLLCFPARDLATYGLVVAAGFHLFVVLYEEPTLRRRFGPEYDEYRARVGRWLPRLRRAERPTA